ncbi:MAG: nicotinate-nucleotide--dimethylbenzimidazole phosphoribosyltransferase [Candidatus Omnitrophica bacterium]|nr:nicotinate-nucleotide--dimethylbenzimidazole phosphoribosyltransferase [Candidatus Omnitrophota bacterium]
MRTVEETCRRISGLDRAAMQRAQDRLDMLTKPRGSLGRLEELAVQFAGILKSLPRECKEKVIFTLAADHGVAVEGVSAYPQEVTGQMVLNFLRGGAAINVLARSVGARVVVVDMGVKAAVAPKSRRLCRRRIAAGTANFLQQPAMSRPQAVQAVAAGIDLVQTEVQRQGISVAAIGEMGIGNTTAASAVVAALTGTSPAAVTGSGTGVDKAGLQRKCVVIETALARHAPDARDAFDVLSKVGGFEIGGMAGIILGAAASRIPVVLDGFIAGAAALIACRLAPAARDFLIAAHCSVEPGHVLVLEKLGTRPLLDLQLRLGEGTGAALALPLLDASVRILNEMASFHTAGVSPAK